MITRIKFGIWLAALLSVIVTCTGCSDEDKLYLSMVAQMHAQKLQAEAAVKYVKRSYKPTDELYSQAQERYVAAYSLNHGAISAAKVAVAADKSLKTVFRVELSNAEIAASDFIAFCTQLRPPSTTRGLVSTVSASVNNFLKENPSIKIHLKQRAVALVEREAQWRSWDEIPM